MSDSPKDFFDEITKEIILSPPVAEDTGKTEDPMNSAETKIIAAPQAPEKTTAPPAKEIQVKIPPKMPEFTEASKAPQGRIIQESSTPTRMAPSPTVPDTANSKAAVPDAEVPDIDVDLSDEPRESVRTDYSSRSVDHVFRSLPPKSEVQDTEGDTFQVIGIGLVLLLLAGGSYYIFKHRSLSTFETSSQVASSAPRTDGMDANWQINLSRSWLNFGPAQKSWKDFQKSIDQAMVDLGPVER